MFEPCLQQQVLAIVGVLKPLRMAIKAHYVSKIKNFIPMYISLLPEP